MTKKVEDWADEQMKDPEFKSAFEDLFEEYQAERLLVMFSDILRLECEEDGTYIVDDYQTVAYGDGETLLEALQDYIVSLIEYSEIILKSQAGWEKIAVKEFVDRVCKRAESNMERTVEGAHYNAMLVELESVKEEIYDDAYFEATELKKRL